MLAGDSAVFETYQKRTTLISEWGRVARYHSRVGHRRCWTAAASKGLLSLVCVVLVLVAMRFASWTMMAVICFSVDDFFFFFFFKQKTAYEIGVRLVGSEMCIRDRSSRDTKPPLSSSDGARSCRMRLRFPLLFC